MNGGSASASISAMAYVQSGYGGDIGDIRILSVGASSDPDVYAYASHNVGDISMAVTGYSAEATVQVTILSGGTVGDIDIQVGGSCNPLDQSEASGEVRVMGSGVSVGNITMSIYGGLGHSAQFVAGDFSGGSALIDNVGDIIFTATADSFSAQSDMSAYTDLSDADNSSVGNIVIDSQGFNGDHEIDIFANNFSGLTAFIGDGSANLRITLLTAGQMEAEVGDISITMGDEHFGSGGDITAMLGSGTQVGTISIDGGSEYSRFKVFAGGDFWRHSEYADYNLDMSYYGYRDYADFDGSGISSAMGDINMSEFKGFANISLSTVEDGVRIDVGLGGSRVRGTEGADDIYLGAGQDTVYFDEFRSQDSSDNLYDFDLSEDQIFISTDTSSFWDSQVDTGSISADALISLVDLVGGQDLSLEEDLAEALMAGGEYAGLLTNSTAYTIATASTYDASSFHLYQVWFNNDIAYAHLMGVVNLATGSEFSHLSLTNVAVM
jgi:hypothetical protein